MNVFVEFVLLGVRFVFFPLSFSAEHISDFFKSNISQYSVFLLLFFVVFSPYPNDLNCKRKRSQILFVLFCYLFYSWLHGVNCAPIEII